jgi:hypothetical protein
VRVPPVLPSAAVGFAQGLSEVSARERLLLLAEEFGQMQLMQQEIKVTKLALRAQDGAIEQLRARNQRAEDRRDTERRRRRELAGLIDAAAAELPLLLRGVQAQLTAADRGQSG